MTDKITALSLVEQTPQLLQFSSLLLKSGICPPHFKSPEAVAGAIIWGLEVGFSPIQAVQSIDIIQGKPAISAAGMKAIVQSKGVVINDIELTDKLATLELIREGVPHRFTFTWADAEIQGLTSKPNWQKMPKAMLYARCVTALIRNHCSDMIRGLYGQEEMRDAEDISVVETPKTPEAPKCLDFDSDELPVSIEPGNYRIKTACAWKGQTLNELKQNERTWRGVQKVFGSEELKSKLLQADVEAFEKYFNLNKEIING